MTWKNIGHFAFQTEFCGAQGQSSYKSIKKIELSRENPAEFPACLPPFYCNPDSSLTDTSMQIPVSKSNTSVLIQDRRTCLALLGPSAKLGRATIGFVLSVCSSVRPSVRMEQLRSHWTDFHEIWYLSIFRKSAWKIRFIIKIRQE
jgi:hypothetical protein